MYIMHIALQGCLRAGQVAYGLTADTGGHIRYLLELVEAQSQDPAVSRIEVVTRAFCGYGEDYQSAQESINAKASIRRFATVNPDYLTKEALWTELPSLLEALDQYLNTLSCKPDVIHAHYADAGIVGLGIKQAHDIPLVFTAHSLGRVKKAHLGDSAGYRDDEFYTSLERRIGFEEAVIAGADVILASSRDEAERQYAHYDHYEPGKIKVVTPGSDLSAFTKAAVSEDTRALFKPFLAEPDKPPILVLARPVWKKNIQGVVKAYGESAELQRRYNLIIVAGCRDDLRELENELRDSMQELLYLIDRYDLYGKVAYPKRHQTGQVPEIYAWARERGGVFVNMAFNEPFGLTLLEASAAGLPVVATRCGGPGDIVERCANGLLVEPDNEEAVQAALATVLGDRCRWQQFSQAGVKAVQAFSWERHVVDYHRLLASLVSSRRAPTALPPCQRLLITDIDNTLLGSDVAIAEFLDWQQRHAWLCLGIATGRSFHAAMSMLREARVPWPRSVITSVGAEIFHLLDDGFTYRKDENWEQQLIRGWRPDEVRLVAESVPGLRCQDELEQKTCKVSYLVEQDDEATVAEFKQQLRRAGLEVSVIYSHGCFVDVLPLGASKGAAVQYLVELYGLEQRQVVVAGDSGNDVEMLRCMPCSVIVGNFRDNIIGLPDLAHAFRAPREYAQGVLDGLEHFFGEVPA